MTPPRRRGRRVPPKHGPRPAPPAFGEPESAASEDAAERVRAATRAQNRAAKRAASGIRPGQVRGRVRSRRGYSPAVLGLAIAGVLAVAGIVIVANPFGGGAGASASPGDSGSVVAGATHDTSGCPTEAPDGLAAGEKRTVTIKTSLGDIVIEVDANLAPVAAANFVALATCGYYNGVIFHRVIPEFVIQGGDGQYGWIDALNRGLIGQGGPGYAFDDEPVIGDYTRGTVAMANSGADTNGSQFFIMVKDSSTLPKNYVIFGHVTSGMDVVDKIVSAPRNSQDLPDNPVAMTSLTVTSGSAASPSPAPASPGTSPAPTAAPSP